MHRLSEEVRFTQLREYLLGSSDIRVQRPHLTLAHPRNPKAPGNSLTFAASQVNPGPVCFTSIFLIEQIDSLPWQILESYMFAENSRKRQACQTSSISYGLG